MLVFNGFLCKKIIKYFCIFFFQNILSIFFTRSKRGGGSVTRGWSPRNLSGMGGCLTGIVAEKKKLVKSMNNSTNNRHYYFGKNAWTPPTTITLT